MDRGGTEQQDWNPPTCQLWNRQVWTRPYRTYWHVLRNCRGRHGAHWILWIQSGPDHNARQKLYDQSPDIGLVTRPEQFCGHMEFCRLNKSGSTCHLWMES